MRTPGRSDRGASAALRPRRRRRPGPPALGNYHNGAPEGRIEAEYIHVDDYLGGVELLTEAARRVSDRANTAFRQRLREVPSELRQRMLDTSR